MFILLNSRLDMFHIEIIYVKIFNLLHAQVQLTTIIGRRTLINRSHLHGGFTPDLSYKTVTNRWNVYRNRGSCFTFPRGGGGAMSTLMPQLRCRCVNDKTHPDKLITLSSKKGVFFQVDK